jgi:leucyl aminopeptidase
MKLQITKIQELKENRSWAVLFTRNSELPSGMLNPQELTYLEKTTQKNPEAVIYRYPEFLFFYQIARGGTFGVEAERARKAGARLWRLMKKEKAQSVQIINHGPGKWTLPFLEGLLLASYSFHKYKKDKTEHTLTRLFIQDDSVTEDELREIQILADAVFLARDFVNEPVITLTAQRLAKEIRKTGESVGFTTEILGKQKIEALKMGGLLAVNKGSVDPPTFSILEWNPAEKKNTRPLVLAGKGVVYDTGGLSLKPTLHSMDYMKSDMSGAAVVIAILYAVARANIPLHIIGLIPATDNRPGGNAITPGDIITMHDGTTVEIKNTDAEGRLLLADALSYAKKYHPDLVLDIATLTGTAERISGDLGIVAMGNTPLHMKSLKKSGDETWERIIELPLWEEFAESLKSPVADLSNLGSREGQASIAGKFLEHFTHYPWIHLDIAGSAFIRENKGYRPKGATGTGIRLLFHFLKNTGFKNNLSS